jgi:hypothetical protein
MREYFVPLTPDLAYLKGLFSLSLWLDNTYQSFFRYIDFLSCFCILLRSFTELLATILLFISSNISFIFPLGFLFHGL